MLNTFFEDGTIALEPSQLLDRAPPPLRDDLEFAKVEGMLLGLAIGDSLGGLRPPDEVESLARGI